MSDLPFIQSLTAEQERFIQSKLQAGKYRSAQEILEIALRLLDEYDRADTAWTEDVREKIDAAISVSDQTPPIDGETFVSQVLERFQQARQTLVCNTEV
ncbi:type II toxin-antitoxin system ParD family antitoxin [Aerosakkonemataceae cyanobacterium BLCC-F154]|uniref:Type II toxin-antitoxin system ParD family antitoxin n=1 Tax=Floridaenema fluviatile BLCC-F154 TaxID=3153640 RepID=A0ABV4YAS3_9CYAN